MHLLLPSPLLFWKHGFHCESSLSYSIRFIDSPRDGLHSRPTILPRNLVPTELLLSIGVSNVRVNVVVVKHPALNRIVVDALATRAVDIVVRFEHDSTAALRARLSCGVDLERSISKKLT
jgi:hypothetical protein